MGPNHGHDGHMDELGDDEVLPIIAQVAAETIDSRLGTLGRHMRHRYSLMLPVNLTLGGMTIMYATAEPTEVKEGAVTFRCLRHDALVVVEGTATCEDAEVSQERRQTVLRVRRQAFTVYKA